LLPCVTEKGFTLLQPLPEACVATLTNSIQLQS